MVANVFYVAASVLLCRCKSPLSGFNGVAKVI